MCNQLLSGKGQYGIAVQSLFIWSNSVCYNVSKAPCTEKEGHCVSSSRLCSHMRRSKSVNIDVCLRHVWCVWQVRKQAAEQLYVQLMTVEDTGVYDEECLDAAFDILTEVAWDGSLELVKAARSQLLQTFQLDAPDSSTATAKLEPLRSIGSRRADENASYQALINDGGRL